MDVEVLELSISNNITLFVYFLPYNVTANL